MAPIKVNFYAPDWLPARLPSCLAARFYGANSVVKCLNTRSLSGNFCTIICLPRARFHFLLYAFFQCETDVSCRSADWRASNAWSKLNVSNFHRPPTSENMQIFNLPRKFDLNFSLGEQQKKMARNFPERDHNLIFSFWKGNGQKSRLRLATCCVIGMAEVIF